MYCVNCGAQVDTDQAFCDACGTQLKMDGVVQQSALSDASVLEPKGMQGERAQQKYLIAGCSVTIIVFLGLILKMFKVI